MRGLLGRFLVVGLLTFGLGIAAAQPVFAADPLDAVCQANPDSATCKSVSPDKNPLTGKDGVLYKVSLIVASVAGLVAVIVIIVSGFQFLVSGGDAQKVAGARRTLIGAIIGLVVIVLAQSIIMFVVGRL